MTELLEKLKVSYNYDRLLSRSEIGNLVLCYLPFLLTSEAWVFGTNERGQCDRINLLYVGFLKKITIKQGV